MFVDHGCKKLPSIFKIKITFTSVKCNWVMRRAYFTFPTDVRLIMQSCPDNALCGWGEHCYKHARFDAEKNSEKANEYPRV